MASVKRGYAALGGGVQRTVDGDVRESYPFWGRDGAVAWADWLGSLVEADVSVEHDEDLTGEFGEWSVLVVTRCPSNCGGGGHAA